MAGITSQQKQNSWKELEEFGFEYFPSWIPCVESPWCWSLIPPWDRWHFHLIKMSTCPGCSTKASYKPEPRRSPTEGLHKRPSATDVSCCSGSLWSPVNLRWAQIVWWGPGRAGSNRAPRWQRGWGGLCRSTTTAGLWGAGRTPWSHPAGSRPPPKGNIALHHRTLTAQEQPIQTCRRIPIPLCIWLYQQGHCSARSHGAWTTWGRLHTAGKTHTASSGYLVLCWTKCAWKPVSCTKWHRWGWWLGHIQCTCPLASGRTHILLSSGSRCCNPCGVPLLFRYIQYI